MARPWNSQKLSRLVDRYLPNDIQRPECLVTDHRSFTLDDLLSSAWDRKIVLSIVDELASLPGEKTNVEEVRRFLALKSCKELLLRVEAARKNKSSVAAIRSIALAIRQFGLERPALFTAALRNPPKEAAELCNRTYQSLIDVFAGCGVYDQAAHRAIHILQSLVRGFVLDELLNGGRPSYPYEDSYETAIDLFIAGLPALSSADHGER